MKNWVKIFLICFVITVTGTRCVPTPKVYAADTEYKWKPYITGDVIDIDPMHSMTAFGIMVHIKQGDSCSWAAYWKTQSKGDYPCIGETGTLYRCVDEDKNAYFKWVEVPVKPKPKMLVTPKIITKIVENDWQNSSNIPEKNKVVVIRFNSGLTSTAYINKYEEWKLDAERETYKGGRTLDDIKEWKDIGI